MGETKGHIEGSTALFGAPFYGERVIGRLVRPLPLNADEYCAPDGYEVPAEYFHGQEGDANYRPTNRQRLIFLLTKRGCSCETLVRVAEFKGAHAVIIVDSDPNVTSEQIRHVILGRGDLGNVVHIPSVLISAGDGHTLMSAANTSEVLVELKWSDPAAHVVHMDLWLSPGSTESLVFLREFAKPRRALNGVLKFQPHYSVFAMPATSPSLGMLCINEGEFCAEDPDGVGPLTGADVLDEVLRQLCLHELSEAPGWKSSHFQRPGSTGTEYASKFWDYVELLPLMCPLDADADYFEGGVSVSVATTQDDPGSRFGSVCAKRLLRMVGADVEAIDSCARDTGQHKLARERENTAWSANALRINGWRYGGILDASLVATAICGGYLTPPVECQAFLQAAKIHSVGANAASDGEVSVMDRPFSGISVGDFIFWLCTCSGAMFASLFLYIWLMRKRVHSSILEAPVQMSTYRELPAAL